MLNLQAVITLKDIGVSVYQTTLIWPLAGLFQTLGPPLSPRKHSHAFSTVSKAWGPGAVDLPHNVPLPSPTVFPANHDGLCPLQPHALHLSSGYQRSLGLKGISRGRWWHEYRLRAAQVLSWQG